MKGPIEGAPKAVRPIHDEWLLRLLAAGGVLTARQVEELRAAGPNFASTEILKRGLLSREALGRAVWERYRIPFADPDAKSGDRLTLSLVPERLCRQYSMAPLKLEGDRLSLLMANPLDGSALDAAAAASGRKPVSIFGLPDSVDALLEAMADPEGAVKELIRRIPDAEPVEWLGGAEEEAQEPEAPSGEANLRAPVIRLANAIIGQAVSLGASDVHIEQEENATQVRCRVDGSLRLQTLIGPELRPGKRGLVLITVVDVSDGRQLGEGRGEDESR